MDLCLSIIIVNYNGNHYLDDCLQYVIKNVTLTYEVIVVDNNSTDNSCDMLFNKYPNVHVLKNIVNLGFAKGNNIGAAKARGKYLLLLNSDTRLMSGVENAVSIMEKDVRIGVVGALMLDSHEEYRASAGYFPSVYRLLKFSNMLIKPSYFKDDNSMGSDGLKYYPVDWVEGSFLMTRLDLWKSVKGMDEDYFLYGEDIAFCRKITDEGYIAVYLPSVRYIHHGGFTIDKLPYLVNGLEKYHRKYSGPFKRNFAIAVLKIGICIRYLYYTLWSLLSENPSYLNKAVILNRICKK